MVKDIYPKKPGRKSAKSVGTVKKTASVTRVKKASYHTAKRPKKKVGILGGFFDEKRGEMDFTFLLLVVVLAAFGLIMMLSASTPTANVKFDNSYYFFIRQLIFVLLGFGLMLFLSRMDYRTLKPYTKLLMIVCIILLAMVFLPGVGVERNGSRRWINLVVFDFQPSELTKLAVSMFFAAMIEERRYDVTKIDGLFKYAIWIGIVAGLMMLETHLSGTMVILGIAVCILLIAGASVKLIVGGGICAGGALALFLAFNPVRMARITSFLDPFADKQGSGYQTLQSLYAIGSGGIFGKGLGESVQKFSYLPEPYNDFIFSVICEELGLVGATFIIILFIGLIIRGIKISMEARDTFGSLMVAGIMAQVAIQTILNIAVATSSMPNTGVSLPFFSYGGTAVMILLAEMGIVLSVSRYSTKNS